MVNESSVLKQKLMLASRFKNDASLTMRLNDNTLDLKKWCKDEDVINFILDESCDQLVVDKVINPNEVAHNLEQAKDLQEFLEICANADVYVTKKEREFLTKDFASQKENVFNRIQADIVLGSKKFMRIKREAVRRFNDESIWYLYVGAYFLTGKTIDGSIIRAPLVLYRVDVVDRDGEIVIVKREKEVTINEKLNLFLNQTYDMNINMEDNNSLSDIKKYGPLLKPLMNGESVDALSMHNLVDFGDTEISDITMSIEPSAVFGLMDPCGGIVLLDYERIVKSGVDPFKEISVISNASYYEDQVIEHDDIVMFNRPLNIYQKYAVKSALGESTLIFGPPGTGKSEVIATVIANILNKQKTVLMVSEKKAALDVLEDRLNSIGDICLFAYNTQDTTYFYNKIKKIHDLLNADANEVSLATAESSYSKIKDMYNDLRMISSFMINNKRLDDIRYIDRSNWQFTKPDVKLALRLMDCSKENNLNILYQEYLDLFTKIMEAKQYFPDVLRKDEFNNLIETAQNSSDPVYVWKTYFLEHKIKKPGLFHRFKSAAKQVDVEGLKYLVNTFVSSNIDQISQEELAKFLAWQQKDICRLQDEVESYLLNKELMKIDYFSNPLLDTLLSNYLNNQKRIVKNVDKYIRDNYIKNLRNWIKSIENSNDIETQNQLKELFRIASLKKAKSVNWTIKTYYKILRKLFPIWILNPVQTSQVTPCEQGIFDYGIFDEASQMFYENSYPLIYRVKTSVVCGDDKQLQPIGTFTTKSFDDSYTDQMDDDSSITSLFEKASTLSWPHFPLRNHYRSASADLISFANMYIYNGEMQTATVDGYFSKAVEVVNVNGRLEDQINQTESDKIMELLVDEYSHRDDKDDAKVLVIAFNNKQMELIENDFNAKMNNLCPEAYNAYRSGSLMFGSVENIQGLEADRVIISLTYSKDPDGVLRTNFGLMGQDGGIARLNVAITRAKDKMTIVKSLYSRDTVSATNENLNILFKFIEWCDKMEKSPSLSEIIADSTVSDLNFESDFELDVYNTLKNNLDLNQYKILSKLNVGSKTIDLCIIDKATENVVLGIQIDESSYNYGLKKMMQELDSQKFFEDRGYKMVRIMLVDWKVRKQIVLNEIFNTLNAVK